MIRPFFAIVLAGLVALAAVPARAGTFEVSPLVAILHAGVSSQTITISNASAEPLRLQVRPFAWSQSADGHELTNPTDDLIVFPALLDIPPGAQRAVRVGLARHAAGDTERTYRIFLLQLPSVASQFGGGARGALEMRVQLSVPLFVAPAHPVARPELAFGGVSGGQLDLRLTNGGSAHVLARKVELEGRDERGARVFARSLPAWYVLAGGERDYRVALAPQECGKLRTLHVVAQTDSGTLSREFPRGAATCR